MQRFQLNSFTLVLIIAILFAGLSSISHAAIITWSGGGIDHLSSNNLNWAGGQVPQNGDDILFDVTSSEDCTWDLSISLTSKYKL